MNKIATLSQQRPFKVLVGIDFSTAGEAALLRALALANLQPSAEVHAVTVREPEPVVRGHEIPPNAASALQELATRAAEKLAAQGRPIHVEQVVTHLLVGEPAREIVWLAAHLDADLIVLGTHGRHGVARLVLGSVAEAVLRTAGCPVLVERAKNHPKDLKTPEIEPPCEQCVETRRATGGAQFWCERHSEHHGKAHRYSCPPDTMAAPFRASWGFRW